MNLSQNGAVHATYRHSVAASEGVVQTDGSDGITLTVQQVKVIEVGEVIVKAKNVMLPTMDVTHWGVPDVITHKPSRAVGLWSTGERRQSIR